MTFAVVPLVVRAKVSLMPIGSRPQAGLTFVGLLIAVVFFGLGAVGAARLLAATERAEREAELLFIGHQFRQAICGFLQSGPRQYPATLDDLLQDRRTPTPRHHLRRLFVDPITGTTDWGLVNAPEGGIMGVYSLSEREPQKRANFEPEDAHFAAAATQPSQALDTPALKSMSSSIQTTPLTALPYSYRDWKFVCRPAALAGGR